MPGAKVGGVGRTSEWRGGLEGSKNINRNLVFNRIVDLLIESVLIYLIHAFCVPVTAPTGRDVAHSNRRAHHERLQELFSTG